MKSSVLVVYASQTGNAESIAKHVVIHGNSLGYNFKLVVADDFEKQVGDSLFIFITSTTGDGDHPDNAGKFWKWLRKSKDVVKLKGAPYGLLGLGDTNYTNYNQPAKKLDRRLIELGAVPFVPKGLADDATGTEATVDPWVESIWELLPGLVSRGSTDGIVSIEPVDISEKTQIITETLVQATISQTLDESLIDKDVNDSNSYLDAESLNRIQIQKILPQETLDGITQLKGVVKLPVEYLTVTESGSRGLADSNIHNLTSTFKAKISSSRMVSGSKALQPIIDMTLDIRGMGYKYEPGDAFGVLVPNVSSEVFALLDRLDLDPTTIVTLSTTSGDVKELPFEASMPCTYFEIFKFFMDIRGTFKKSLLRVLAEYTPDMNQKKALMYMTTTAGVKAFKALKEECFGLLDLLNTFESCKPPVGRVLEQMSKLQPRYYSIRNAPGPVSNETEATSLSFTFNVIQEVKTTPLGNVVNLKGLASNYLDTLNGTHRSPIPKVWNESHHGDVAIFARTVSQSFHLPSDLSREFVFIAAGTGISPFIGFLEHLKLSGSKGKVTLLYGHRFGGLSSESDTLFQDEIDGFVKDGNLKWMDVISRDPIQSVDGKQVKYVQDALQVYSTELWSALENGHVYICGSVKMAQAVHATLVQLTVEKKGILFEDAIRFWDNKSNEKTYLKDVWG